MSLLRVEDVWTAYGPIVVNRGVSIEVDEGEIVTIIGSNGAGKSTLLKTIAGLMRPKSGAIRLLGENVTGIYADGIARRGAVLVPEGRRIFPDLTVRDNLRLGGYSRTDTDGVESDIAAMESFFPILAERRDAKGSALSGGQQQMLAIARGLMAKPKISDPRRAVAGSRANYRARSALNHFVGARQIQRGGAARGAERGLGACGRRSRLHHAERAHCRRGRDRRAAKPRPGPRDLSRQPSGSAAFAWRRNKVGIMTATHPTGRSRRVAAEGVAIRTLGRAPNLPSQVARMISDEILRGRFKVGERLPTERELAETFGVSSQCHQRSDRATDLRGHGRTAPGIGRVCTRNARGFGPAARRRDASRSLSLR